MKNAKQGHRGVRRLTAMIAALTAAVLLSLPAAAATVTASDVMIRNSGEEKDNNIIGVLNEGDKVTVRSKTTDAAGTEWFLVELPNGNTGYVKAQWVDNGSEEVETVQQEQSAPEAEETSAEETQEQEPAADDQAGEDQAAEAPAAAPAENEAEAADDEEGLDDWTEEDAEMLAGTPAVDADRDADAADEKADDSAALSQETPEVDNGETYDPYTDPNAQYSINFVSESDGTGSWYIYNYDTDKTIRIGDLEKLSDAQNAAQKSAASAGIWRTAACIFLILLIALLIFLYILLKRNGYGRPAPARRSSRRRSAVREEDEEEEYEDYDEEEEEDDDEFAPEEEGDAMVMTEDAASSDEEDRENSGDTEELINGEAPEESEESGTGSESAVRSVAASTAAKLRKAAKTEVDEDYDEDDEDEEYDGDEDYDYDGDEEDDEDGPARKSGVFGFLKNFFSAASADDDEYDEDDDDYDDEDEDYDEDEEYDEEEEDLNEEEEAPVRRNSGRRKAARTSSQPRSRNRQPRQIEFDEESDYPEDAELLAFARRGSGSSEEDARKAEPAVSGTGRSGAASGGRTQESLEPEEDLDFFADEDDDMEYSFLSGSSRRAKR